MIIRLIVSGITSVDSSESMKLNKKFSLSWAFEAFQDDPSFISKKMFGGLSAYVHGRIVMVLCESPGDRLWRGKTYSFDIWNGILIPTEREFHSALIKEFPSLINHPVLSKWLYLPMTTSDFEEVAEKVAHLITKDDERFGVVPKPRLQKPKRNKKKK